ncbi:FAD-binding oxidoreductase [Maliponia aquimaris]|uniref:Putative FAD-linked oxidoreductase YvdP n=1 Tax=Maliponia aquimaris TaxID=1673631 RepID=A0A238L750_9RHOB|nr:FAD-binding oxidoreductase [Maliponia aquimaris]SMX50660.1 putative FAD-linked oxidoreductase YvdP [Maliponia aquimaris]
MRRDHREHRRHKEPRWKTLKKKESGLPAYKSEHLDRLRQDLSGRVQLAGAPGYNDDRMVFMHTYQQYPQVIVYCECDTDVVAALKFARRSGLQVATRSGGHCTAGFSVNDQVVIDTSGLDHVIVDPETPSVRCGPGVPFRKLNRVLDFHRLHLPGGGCETVNVAGYMMGGGYGFTSRLFGMNCDRVTGVRMALADGTIVTANDAENKDLYWAVRGGTGNQFGVLLEIFYDPVPLDRKFFGFGLRWNMRHRHEADVARVCRVLEQLQAEYSNSGPPRMGHQALMMYLPDADHPNGQTPCLCLRGLYDGTEAEAKAALDPLLATLEDPRADVEIWTHKHHYTRLNEILLQTVDPPGRDMPTVSMNTKPLVEGWLINEHHPAERWREVVDHFLNAPDKTCFVALEFYGGAIAEPAPTDMAFVHRDPSVDMFSWAFWTFDTHQQASVDWLDGLGALATGMGSGRRYQNYPRRGTTDFLDAYFGQNLPRLQQIKARYDPHNMFWFEQSLGPKPAPAGSHDIHTGDAGQAEDAR